MTKTERFYIRLTPELKEKLKAAAAAENRSAANFVVTIVEKYLNEKTLRGEK